MFCPIDNGCISVCFPAKEKVRLLVVREVYEQTVEAAPGWVIYLLKSITFDISYIIAVDILCKVVVTLVLVAGEHDVRGRFNQLSK